MLWSVTVSARWSALGASTARFMAQHGASEETPTQKAAAAMKTTTREDDKVGGRWDQWRGVGAHSMGIYSTAGPEMHSRWYFAKEGRTIPRLTRTHTGTCGQQEYLLNVGEQRMRKPSIQRAETLKRFESTSSTNSQIEGPVWNIYEGGLHDIS